MRLTCPDELCVTQGYMHACQTTNIENPFGSLREWKSGRASLDAGIRLMKIRFQRQKTQSITIFSDSYHANSRMHFMN